MPRIQGVLRSRSDCQVTSCYKASRTLVTMAIAAVIAGCGRADLREAIVLPREPYLGLVCHGSAYPCHRLGLAVWLPSAARVVTAKVDGRSVRLVSRPARGAGAARSFWEGFFRDDRAERYCDEYPHRLAVDVVITAAGDDERVVSARPLVSCGYG